MSERHLNNIEELLVNIDKAFASTDSDSHQAIVIAYAKYQETLDRLAYE